MAEGLGENGIVFLGPAEIVVTREPVRVKTVLGSCVAITMYVRRLGWTAIVHCLLPRAYSSARAVGSEEALRYVDTAVEVMCHEALRQGAQSREMEIKLFGGAETLFGGQRQPYQVGRMNVKVAEETLAARGLAVAARCTGGTRGRVIEFDCQNGSVLVRKLPARFHPPQSEGR